MNLFLLIFIKPVQNIYQPTNNLPNNLNGEYFVKVWYSNKIRMQAHVKQRSDCVHHVKLTYSLFVLNLLTILLFLLALTSLWITTNKRRDNISQNSLFANTASLMPLYEKNKSLINSNRQMEILVDRKSMSSSIV